MAHTLASFHEDGNTPSDSDLLKMSQRGLLSSDDNSRNTLLFISSGPEALPIGRDFKTDSTSSGVMAMRESEYVLTGREGI